MKLIGKFTFLYIKLSIVFFIYLFTFSVDRINAQPYEGWLYTASNKIYKSDGTVFVGRGANIFDTRSCWAGNASAPNVDEVNRRVDELVDVWGADFMRLCLQSQDVLDGWMVHGLPVTADTNYVNDIVEIIEHIGTKDSVYVLVSVWADDSFDDLGWPTTGTIDVWRILTQNLAQYSHVLFGVCNEPESNYNGALDAQVWERMNNTVTAIREEETTAGSHQHIITVQGTRGWAREIDYYVDHPITAGGGTNIAYETHVYNHESDFDELFISPSEDIPVVIGEFGPAVMNGDIYMTMDECELMMDTADVLQIPYLAWSFHQRCPPNLLVDVTGSGSGAGMDLIPTEWGELLMYHLLGIEVPKINDFVVNPSSVSNLTDTKITFSATVTNDDGDVESVTLDLSELGGGSNIMMTNTGDSYSATYTVAEGTGVGVKTITLTALNEQGYTKSESTDINVYTPATDDMIIYNDDQTLIEATWKGRSEDALSESSTGAYEGTEHYQFDYDITGWWANFGLNLCNYTDGEGYDFTGFKSLQLACKITGTATVAITLKDADGTVSESVEISGINSGYQVFEIPLTSFTGLVLNDVGELQIDLYGVQTESGTLNIDNIILLSNSGSTSSKNLKANNIALMQNRPNPFSYYTTIGLRIPQSDHYILKIYDINGREVAELLNQTMNAGNYSIKWDGTNANKNILENGIYFYKLKAGNGYEITRKMILIK